MATLAIHAGSHVPKAHNAVMPPIVTSSSFSQVDINSNEKYCYSRCSNPTRNAYEEALTELEGGIYATATSSGMAATSLALELLEKDSHVIVVEGVYGGTYRIFEKLKKKTTGLRTSYVNMIDLEKLEKLVIEEETKMIWLETPSNPLLHLVDIAKICEIAKRHQTITCVDNTFATAWNQRPLSLGADIVMLSTSKYIGGHSDLIGGALITNRSDLAEELDFIKTTVGAVASPFDSYLALRGLKTLDLRMTKQCSNALKIATHFENHSKIREVYYPGLSSHPQNDLCKRQMKSGGAVVTIRLDCESDGIRSFLSKLKYFVLAESLGGIESMINHTASMSHGSMSPSELEAIGIYESTLRLSIGAEDPFDLIEDIEAALTAF